MILKTGPKSVGISRLSFRLREGMIGETIFVKKWQKLMGGKIRLTDPWFLEHEEFRFPFLSVLNKDYYVPDERDTRNVTSLIRWLGSNVGQSFLDEARQMAIRMNARDDKDRGLAYLAIWAAKNTESTRVGSIREMLTAPLKDVFGEAACNRDFEMLERTVKWLGTRQGQKFIYRCEEEIRNIHAGIVDQRKARPPSIV